MAAFPESFSPARVSAALRFLYSLRGEPATGAILTTPDALILVWARSICPRARARVKILMRLLFLYSFTSETEGGGVKSCFVEHIIIADDADARCL